MDDDDRQLDLGAWPAQAPPEEFADRVMARLDRKGASSPPQASPKSTRAAPAPLRSRIVVIAGAIAAAAIATLVWRVASDHGLDSGHAIARDRETVQIGDRVTAVLEAGSDVSWDGSSIAQEAGDVFFRVERAQTGAPVEIRTPSGTIQVRGTCFRVRVWPAAENADGQAHQPEVIEMEKKEWRAALLGATVTGATLVGVYEGKVLASSGSGELELGAGESAALTKTGAFGLSADEEREAAERLGETPASSDPAMRANANLVDEVRGYKRRLDGLEREKAFLERDLHMAQQKLASATDGAAPKLGSEFDLSQEDWAELAKTGTIKFRMPCYRSKPYTPTPDALNALGLAPQDGPVVADAYARSNERIWNAIRPICAKTAGSEALADKLGLNTCTHMIVNVAHSEDREAASEAMRQVGEIRAGQRPPPRPGEPMHPVAQTFWELTGENARFEADLAAQLGPDDAHRVAFSDELCQAASTFGGPGPRKK